MTHLSKCFQIDGPILSGLNNKIIGPPSLSPTLQLLSCPPPPALLLLLIQIVIIHTSRHTDQDYQS